MVINNYCYQLNVCIIYFSNPLCMFTFLNRILYHDLKSKKQALPSLVDAIYLTCVLHTTQCYLLHVYYTVSSTSCSHYVASAIYFLFILYCQRHLFPAHITLLAPCIYFLFKSYCQCHLPPAFAIIITT